MPDETQQPTPEPAQPELIPENPVSEPNPAPVSPDEPTAEASLPPKESVPAPEPSVTPETPQSPEGAILDKDQNPANEPFDGAQSKPSEPVPNEPNNQNITVEKHGNDVTITEVMEQKPETAQMAGNEPLPVSTESSDEAKQKRKENLERANIKRQEKKREKINEILNLFSEKPEVTNDEVEKLLHVSDATATRYLEQLEKEGKIKQVGKTGKAVKYEKI